MWYQLYTILRIQNNLKKIMVILLSQKIIKEFFKDNFDFVGRTFLKFTHKNGCEETKFVGVLCTTKDKKEKEND